MRTRFVLPLLLMATLASPLGALAATGIEPTEASLRAGFKQLQAAMDRDDQATASRLAAQCLSAARKSGNLSLLAEALLMQGEANLSLPKDSDARKYLLNALGLAVELGDARLKANALNDLGILCERGGNGYGAESYYRDALAIAETLDDPLLLDAATYDLGSLEVDKGEFESGYARLKSVLDRATQRNDSLNAVKVMVRLGEIERAMKKPEVAEASANEALKLSQTVKHWPSEQAAHRLLALLSLDREDATGAESHLQAALALATTSKDSLAIANASFDLGQFYISKGRRQEAIEQITLAQKSFKALGKPELVQELQKMLNKLKSGQQI